VVDAQGEIAETISYRTGNVAKVLRPARSMLDDLDHGFSSIAPATDFIR
jgi:hypothetical protein